MANGPMARCAIRFSLPRGYWEAKDTRDDLLVEIRKKTAHWLSHHQHHF